MYNSGNSSKNVTGSNIIDGTVEAADLATAVNNDIAAGVAASTTAGDALPKAGGAMTGAITTNSTFDGVDVATRDGVLTTTTATANDALPKTGGAMTGAISGLTATGEVAVTAVGNATENLASFGNNAGTNQLIVEQSGSSGYTIKSSVDLRLHADYDNNTSAGGSNIIMYTDATERMRIVSSGNTFIGGTTENQEGAFTIRPNTSNGSCMIQMNRATTTATSNALVFYDGGAGVGAITYTDTATAYGTSSDYRLKENVVPMTGSIDRLKALKPSKFNFIRNPLKTVDGFLAHEAGNVVPECVIGTKDAMMDEEYEVTPAVMDGDTVVTEAVMGTRSVPDYQAIDQSKLVPLLVAALQEAIARIEVLETP